MYLMEELELSLVASEPRRLHSVALDVLRVGDRIASVSDDLLLLAESDAVDTTLRDDRAKGLWKQNIALLASSSQSVICLARFRYLEEFLPVFR